MNLIPFYVPAGEAPKAYDWALDILHIQFIIIEQFQSTYINKGMSKAQDCINECPKQGMKLAGFAVMIQVCTEINA
jgi:hypothetical protein